MTFPNTTDAANKEGRSPSGRESGPQLQCRTDRYDSPDVVRLGEIADVSHDRGGHRESVASYWQT